MNLSDRCQGGRVIVIDWCQKLWGGTVTQIIKTFYNNYDVKYKVLTIVWEDLVGADL